MSKVKVGPLWNRAVFDGEGRKLKYRFRSLGFEQILRLRLREYIAPFEEEQLLNAHPEVQKMPRGAELWVDTTDKRSLRVATAEQAGLLLMAASDAAKLVGVPMIAERTHFDTDGDGDGPTSQAA
jgi:hypothetical protein